MTPELWTDGGCDPNPGRGAWAYALVENGAVTREASGSEPQTTNNRMELTAVIEGLRILPLFAQVTVVVDSTYVEQAFNDGWVRRWIANDWRRSVRGQPVKNVDLWKLLVLETMDRHVSWRRVKGHAGVAMNDYVDRLATSRRTQR